MIKVNSKNKTFVLAAIPAALAGILASVPASAVVCANGTGGNLSLDATTQCLDNTGTVGAVTVAPGITASATWSTYTGGGTVIANDSANGNASIASITVNQGVSINASPYFILNGEYSATNQNLSSNTASIGSITNSGSVTGTLFYYGDRNSTLDTLTNNGAIAGGVYVYGSNASIQTLVNNAGATMSTINISSGTGTINSLTNAGTISTISSAGVIGTLSNSGTITTISGAGMIGTLSNSGTITSLSRSGSGSITSLNNTGTINSLNSSGAGTITSLTNSAGGTIRTLSNSANIGTLTNSGTITTFNNNASGTITTFNAQANGSVTNAGTVTTLNNAAQLTWTNKLPTNYAVTISSINSGGYGTITFVNPNGTTAFAIDPASTLTQGRYENIVSGLAASNFTGSLPNGTISGTQWRLVADNGGVLNVWDLVYGSASSGSSNAGEIHATARGLLIDSDSRMRDALSRRMRGAFKSTDIALAEPATEMKTDAVDQPDNATAWGEVFGSWGRINANANSGTASVRNDYAGFIVGADKPVAHGWRVGLMGSYGRSNFQASELDSKGNSDNYQVGVYAGTRIDALRVHLGAAHTWHQVGVNRTEGSDQLASSYQLRSAQLFGEVGYALPTTGKLALEPFASLAHIELSGGAVNEQGAASALSSGSESSGVTFTTAGLNASMPSTLGQFDVSLRGTVGWRHAFGEVTPTLAMAAGGGSAVRVPGAPIAQESAVVQGGVSLQLRKNATLDLQYQGQFSGQGRDNSVNARLAVTF